MKMYDDCPTQRQICNFFDQGVNCMKLHWYKLKVHIWWLDQQRKRYEGAKINIGFTDLFLITTTGYIGIHIIYIWILSNSIMQITLKATKKHFEYMHLVTKDCRFLYRH